MPPLAQSVSISDTVDVLTSIQEPSAFSVVEPPSAMVVVPSVVPSNLMTMLSPALTYDGRTIVVVNSTGLEQSTVAGEKVIPPVVVATDGLADALATATWLGAGLELELFRLNPTTAMPARIRAMMTRPPTMTNKGLTPPPFAAEAGGIVPQAGWV
jgi:hypothetical protein